MQNPLIDPNQTWLLWFALLSCAAFGFAVEHTKVGRAVSGAIITMLAASVLSNLTIIPITAPVYETVWSYLVPLAIPLLLFNANLSRIVQESSTMLIGFLIAVTGTIAGVVVAAYLVPLNAPIEQIAAVFAATYTGGSMNFASTAQAIGLPAGDLLAASVAADSLMSMVFLLVLFFLASSSAIQHYLGTRENVSMTADTDGPEQAPLEIGQLATALAVATGICAISFAIQNLVDIRGFGILLITTSSVVLATVFPSFTARLRGSEIMGIILMQIFFAAIGAAANIPAVLAAGPSLFAFAFVLLVVHIMVLLIGGRWLRINAEDLLVASNAAIGGPTTAAAMASAQRWRALITPAILVGTLGYAIGTFIGISVFNFFGAS